MIGLWFLDGFVGMWWIPTDMYVCTVDVMEQTMVCVHLVVVLGGRGGCVGEVEVLKKD